MPTAVMQLFSLTARPCFDPPQVRYWDVTAGEQAARLDGHADYVRSVAASPGSPDVWATGSYDHTVRLWDVRSNEVRLFASLCACYIAPSVVLHKSRALVTSSK